jgi:hypothetical protein
MSTGSSCWQSGHWLRAASCGASRGRPTDGSADVLGQLKAISCAVGVFDIAPVVQILHPGPAFGWGPLRLRGCLIARRRGAAVAIASSALDASS